MKLKTDGIKMFNPEHYETRSQDLVEAGPFVFEAAEPA